MLVVKFIKNLFSATKTSKHLSAAQSFIDNHDKSWKSPTDIFNDVIKNAGVKLSDVEILSCIETLTIDVVPDNNDPYVYFIYEDNPGKLFKIGYTCDLTTRLSQLQTGNPRELKIYKFIKSKFARNIETYLHRKYKSTNVRLEWYNITITEIDKIIDCFRVINRLYY
jgi:hypothetical protein